MESLKGSTPKEKYDNLIAMQQLLSVVAFPRRGTAEEALTIYDIATLASDLVEYESNYGLPSL